jgi:hypothetical protein
MNGMRQLRAVTNHSVEYMWTWCWPRAGWVIAGSSVRKHFIAQVLLAAGRGPARAVTCQRAAQNALGNLLLSRVVSLLYPGELPSLHVTNSAIFFDFEFRRSRGDDQAAALSQALNSVQSLMCPNLGGYAPCALGLVKRSVGTLKELDCKELGSYCLQEADAWNEVLPRCTRLERLTFASSFLPAAWLGLSQLHTLLDVDLSVVSVAAIAAALPRLHTFGVTCLGPVETAVVALAGFFDTLLPRLRSFRFNGPKWCVDDAIPTGPAQPLPLLEELVWECGYISQHGDDGTDIVDGFAGARPVTLCAPSAAIIKHAADHPGADNLLARVRNLRLHDWTNSPERASDVAAVLRAAPELRTLHGGRAFAHLDWRTHPAFAGLVHRKLRALQFTPNSKYQLTDEDYAEFSTEYDELKAHHFPRLRALTVVPKSGNSC